MLFKVTFRDGWVSFLVCDFNFRRRMGTTAYAFFYLRGPLARKVVKYHPDRNSRLQDNFVRVVDEHSYNAICTF